MTAQTVPEPIKLWIEDLRSGEYTQTSGTLEENKSFCCLGVSCKTAQKNGIEINQHGLRLNGNSLDSQTNVFNWLNLDECCGKFRGEMVNGHNSLAKINDGDLHSFDEIADFIEERWQDLIKKPD